jgi:hypothetical protein
MIANKIFKVLLLPYLIMVFLAMCIGNAKTKTILGSTLLEEYLVVLVFFILYEAQVFIVAKLESKNQL